MAETYAQFVTNEGNFTVRLFDEQAPRTVENFVGLAEGSREWSDPRTNQTVVGAGGRQSQDRDEGHEEPDEPVSADHETPPILRRPM